MKISTQTLAAAAVAASSLVLSGTPAEAQQPDSEGSLEEIIVTALKRESRLRDVPGSVSAMTGEQLQDIGAQSLADYINSIPGVTFNNYQPGVSEVVIRGISSTTYHEQGQTVVGYYINEVPLSEPGWPIVIPDVDTFDLERVEVLRGPQGTLFGSSSLGGLINYIAREADPAAFDSAFEASYGQTAHSDGNNYAVKAMVNLPLAEDRFAIRAVALQRFDTGYLDNVNTGAEDANDLETTGGRLSAVFRASETTRLSWLSLFQKSELDDQTYATVPTLTRDTFVPEPHEPELTIHSLRLDSSLSFGDLTVLGAASEKESRIVFDQTATGFLQGIPTETVGNASADAVNFEVRLSSRENSRFGWLVGAMYQESDKESADDVIQPGAEAFVDAKPADFGGNPGSLLAPGDVISSFQIDQDNDEVAVFGEVNFDLTDNVELTVGGRYFDTSTSSTVTRPPSATFIGVFDPVGTQFTAGADETGFTPKVSIAYRPNDSLMLFGLYSEGFRVGGANPNPPSAVGAGASPAYDSDSVQNFEVGIRSDLLDNRLRIDATVFHIDWEDIQVRLFTPAPLFLAYVTNAGAADIDGVELSFVWQPNGYVDFDTNLTWQDARLAEFLPDTFAPGGGHPDGSTLPGASEWSIYNKLALRFDSAWNPVLTIGHQYQSGAPVAFSSSTERGDFSLIDLRLTATISEQLDVSLFVDNVADEYGILNAPFSDFFPQPLGSVTRPRTWGLTLNWNMN